MTNKEEIIIDGVPVQDCCYFDYENDGYEDSCDMYQNECSAQNCYYKQFKRKEQECEELKKEIINKNEKIKELRFSVSDLTNRLCYLNAEKSFRIVDLEQTLDEIEKELKERLERTEEDLKYQCVDCMNVKSDRYRKALEEIEEYTKEQFCDNCEDIGSTEYSCHCEYCEYQEYLTIINKAKGEGNAV